VVSWRKQDGFARIAWLFDGIVEHTTIANAAAGGAMYEFELPVTAQTVSAVVMLESQMPIATPSLQLRD
jgi:hypothetical protein